MPSSARRERAEHGGGSRWSRSSGSRPVLVAGALALVLLGSVAVACRRGGDGGPTIADRGVASAAAADIWSTGAGSADVGSSSDGAPRPAIGLAPGLVRSYDRARAAAAAAGHDLVINSGFRTPARQQELLDEEVAKRGSYEEATRWVFPPDRSMHVQGLAIDVGDRAAAAWLAEHGARFGLCHTLSWEWWHFEWRARWQAARACPREAADPSEAPPR